MSFLGRFTNGFVSNFKKIEEFQFVKVYFSHDLFLLID